MRTSPAGKKHFVAVKGTHRHHRIITSSTFDQAPIAIAVNNKSQFTRLSDHFVKRISC